MSDTPIFDTLNSYRERGEYYHDGIWSDFGYTWCTSCRGEWEGPEKPEDSPCTKEAQEIRKVRESWEYWMSVGDFTMADGWMGFFHPKSLAFDEDGDLKDAYWN